MSILDTNSPALGSASGVLAAQRKVLLTGEGKVTGAGFITVEADFSGRCEKPVTVYHHGRTSYGALDVTETKPRYLILETKCRKCAQCLRDRQWHWTQRAKSELALSRRTWFGTLTLTPDAHHEAWLRAVARAAQRGLDFELASQERSFIMRHNAIGPQITRWLKRIRSESGANLRYMLIAEKHKSGLPHYHALIHERGAVTVGERTLRRQWSLGFSKWNLVDPLSTKEAHYVCKYLSKDAAARVRASLRYGEAE